MSQAIVASTSAMSTRGEALKDEGGRMKDEGNNILDSPRDGTRIAECDRLLSGGDSLEFA
jgi:hypothetical protein